MRITFKILILLTILNCSNKDTTPFDNKTVEDIPAENKSNHYQDTLHLTNVTTHYFSSSIVKDTFKLTLTGQTITDGKLEFEIKTNYGLVIHYETYPSYYLIGYGLDDTATEIQKREYIKGRLLSFFNEENFRQPAISKDEIFDEDYSNKDVWDDIKSDTTSVKFEYLIGEESHEQIAYSKKLKKVVTTFSCC